MKTEKMNYFKNSLSVSKPLFAKLADSSRAVNSFAKFIQIILVLSYLPNLTLIADLFILSSPPPSPPPKHPHDGLGEITKGIYSRLKKETSPWQGHPQKNQGQSISLLEMQWFSEEDSPGLVGSSAWEYGGLEGS